MSNKVTPIIPPVQPSAWDRAVFEHNWMIFCIYDRPGEKPGKFPVMVGRVDAPCGAETSACHTFDSVGRAVDLMNQNLQTTPRQTHEGNTVQHYARGYLPRPDSALVLGDLDGCYDMTTGAVQDWALEVLNASKTYAEVSVSGTGIRMLMERMPDDDQYSSGEGNGAGFFANGGRGAVLTFNKLPGHDMLPVRAPAVRDALLARKGDTGSSGPHVSSQITDPVPYDLVAAMLQHLSNDVPPPSDRQSGKRGLHYDKWRDVLFAVKASLGDAGADLFAWWSAQAECDVPATTAKKYAKHTPHADPTKRITFGTLHDMVRTAHGGQLPDGLAKMMSDRRIDRFGLQMPVLQVASMDPSDPWADMPDFEGERSTHDIIPANLLHGAPVPSRRWLVKDWIPTGTVTLLNGDGGTGKSTIALQLCVATTLCLGWMGQPVIDPGAVLYLGAEDDRDEVHRRLSKIVAGYQRSFADLGRLHLWDLAGKSSVLAVQGMDGGVIPTTLMDDLKAKVGALRPRLVVLDTLANLFGGNENDRVHAQQFMQLLIGLAIQNECAVVLLAHPSKSGIEGDGTSGSTAWRNSARSLIYVSRLKVPDGQDFDPDLRLISRLKGNHAQIGDQFAARWNDGRFVPDQETSPDRVERNILAEGEFLRMLDKFHEQGRVASDSSGRNFAPKAFTEHDDNTHRITKFEFDKAMDRLLDRSVIKIIIEGSPSKPRRSIHRVDTGDV